MAKVNKGEVIQKAVKILRIDAARDSLPSESVDKIMPVIVLNETGEIKIQNFAAATGDQIFTVPENKTIELQGVFSTVATTATVGNRAFTLTIESDAGTEIYSQVASFVQAASVSRTYNWSQYNGVVASITGTDSVAPFPSLLKSGWVLRLHDRNNTDSSDPFTGAFIWKEYEQTED